MGRKGWWSIHLPGHMTCSSPGINFQIILLALWHHVASIAVPLGIYGYMTGGGESFYTCMGSYLIRYESFGAQKAQRSQGRTGTGMCHWVQRG